jgi:hypothetical protein
MLDPLEHELRRLSLAFAVDIRLAVLHSMRSALAAVAALEVYRTLPGADTTARAANTPRTAANATTAIAARHRPRRRAPIAAERAVVRAQVTALIWPEPDQSVAELARAVGLTSTQLRSQLRQLAEEG